MQQQNHSTHESLDQKRHSLEHVMVLAARRLYGENILLGVGPVIENGFYQDFDFKFNDEDLPKLEAEMRAIIAENLEFSREEVEIAELIAEYERKGQRYKVELLKDIQEKGSTKMNSEAEEAVVANLTASGKVTVYTVGIHRDLCRGPHVASTGELAGLGFKLERIAGAYWRGDEKNPMLTRIYGLAFADQPALDDYLAKLELARQRDHRVLGKQLDLFLFSELVGKQPIYTQRGNAVLEEMRLYSQELNRSIGFSEVWTPQINRAELFKVSGHYEKYHQDMLRVVSQYEDEEYFLKPMNCPQHTQVYAAKQRSYRDLPIRISDFANLYRDELPGTLNGLLRLRYFRQDDGHAFCRPDQVAGEIQAIAGVIKQALQTYGMKEYYVRLSLRGDDHSKYVGDKETWDNAEANLREIAETLGFESKLGLGEAAIYGPKLDFMTVDALGREWQVSTVQLDLNTPKRFGLTYKTAEDTEETPVMIHRAIIGGIERFFAIVMEQYGGAFPSWLAPVHVALVPISEDQVAYAQSVKEQLEAAGNAVGKLVRVEIYDRADTMQAKIKDASDQKVPYILVLGKREAEAGAVAVRVRGVGNAGVLPTAEFAERLVAEIKSRSLELSVRG